MEVAERKVQVAYAGSLQAFIVDGLILLGNSGRAGQDKQGKGQHY